ncbi:MAG: flagellar motor switch protein FliM [Oscillospiraceae bacterium]|nr:flagellar motor switch protein FliM [Oscillospiraceae bacterium]
MADVLSQSEIDALLNALSSGDVAPESMAEDPALKIKDYDFRTANRFSKEQIKTFNIIYDTFARLFTSYLSGTLRVMCSADVVSVEEVKYQEFVNAMPSPIVLGILKTPPLVGPTMLSIAPDVAYVMISRLLGGSNQSGSLEISRTFTEIELVLLERIIRQFIGLLVESWAKILPITTMLDRIETSPQFAQIVSMTDTIALITINVKIGSNEGLINFVLPHLALEPIAKQLSTKLMFTTSDARRHASKTDDIKTRIQTTPLPVTAVFTETGSNVRDILGLQAGDIIQLDHNINLPLTLKVGHLPKFHGIIGVKDNRYAVRITELIREEVSDNE